MKSIENKIKEKLQENNIQWGWGDALKWVLVLIKHEDKELIDFEDKLFKTMVKKCECGNNILSIYNFCSNCGKKLKEVKDEKR